MFGDHRDCTVSGVQAPWLDLGNYGRAECQGFTLQVQAMLMKEELGVTPVINCAGNLTVLGGNVVDEEVIDAMKEAASSFFDMPELHRKAGEYIAKLIGVEDAYIVNGGEAGIVLSLSACM